MERRFYISKLTGYTSEGRAAGSDYRLGPKVTFYVYDTLHGCTNVAEFSARGKQPSRIVGALYAARAAMRRLENDWQAQHA